jgi:hypothetical protein
MVAWSAGTSGGSPRQWKERVKTKVGSGASISVGGREGEAERSLARGELGFGREQRLASALRRGSRDQRELTAWQARDPQQGQDQGCGLERAAHGRA